VLHWNSDRRKAIALAVGLVLSSGLAAQARNLDEIREKGVIRFALYNDYPPYSVRGTGLDLDIAGAIAKRLKVKLDTLWFDADENVDDDLRNMVWKGHYLGHGPADVMIHAPVDRELQKRTPQAKLIAPYYRESLAIARNTEKVGRADDMGFLADTLIGVEIDSLASIVLLAHQGGQYRERIRHYKSPRLAVEAFLKGEVQAVMAQKGEVEGLLKGRANVAIAPPPIPGAMAQRAWAVGLAVKSSNAELAAAVEAAVTEMASDGELEKLFAAHGLSYVRP
jgi:ABC-type amino acid transport substrate-binding protein